MNQEGMKEVDFTFCLRCAYWDRGEDQDPCHDCMNHPYRKYSSKPMHYQYSRNSVVANGDVTAMGRKKKNLDSQ